MKNSKHFATVISDKTVNDDEILVSYDVSALFTSVPVDKALQVIQERLLNDTSLLDRTPLSPERRTRLLELCLKCTYLFMMERITSKSMGLPWDRHYLPLFAICIWNILNPWH